MRVGTNDLFTQPWNTIAGRNWVWDSNIMRATSMGAAGTGGSQGLIGGIVLPFFKIIKLIEATFFLSFLSWGISTLGLALGTVGFTLWNRNNKR